MFRSAFVLHMVAESTIGMQMVFSSSCTVYGNPSKVPIDETHPLNACSPYGRTKLIIEDMFRDLAASPEGKEWRIILLRYFNPVGAHPSGLANPLLEYHARCIVFGATSQLYPA